MREYDSSDPFIRVKFSAIKELTALMLILSKGVKSGLLDEKLGDSLVKVADEIEAGVDEFNQEVGERVKILQNFVDEMNKGREGEDASDAGSSVDT